MQSTAFGPTARLPHPPQFVAAVPIRAFVCCTAHYRDVRVNSIARLRLQRRPLHGVQDALHPVTRNRRTIDTRCTARPAYKCEQIAVTLLSMHEDGLSEVGIVIWNTVADCCWPEWCQDSRTLRSEAHTDDSEQRCTQGARGSTTESGLLNSVTVHVASFHRARHTPTAEQQPS